MNILKETTKNQYSTWRGDCKTVAAILWSCFCLVNVQRKVS